MKEIILSSGDVTLVSDEDFNYLNKFNWSLFSDGERKYAYRGKWINDKFYNIFMHQEIAIRHNLKLKKYIDHKDHDGLNNQYENIRCATGSENNANAKLNKISSSGFRGVYFRQNTLRYQARIGFKKQTINLGTYDTAIEAAVAYDSAARKLYKDFATLNFP
jgi:hypothetical protein